MEAVAGLLLLLLGVCQGVETHCDGRLDGAQCYGVLGGTVVFQLMDDASKIPRYEWEKERTIILKGRKDKILVNSMESRSLFIPSNGTFLMNNLIRTDFGEYTFMVFDSDGKKTGSRTLQLSVKEIKPMTVVAGVLSALLILLVVGVVVFYVQKIKQNNKVNKEEEDVQDITYADVRLVQQQGRQLEQRPDVEVEYDQVKFSERPQ